jgi:hypothetical protein
MLPGQPLGGTDFFGESSVGASGNYPSAAWFQYGSTSEGNQLALYAISSVLTVPDSTPEPGSASLAAMGAAALFFRTVLWKRRRRLGPALPPETADE